MLCVTEICCSTNTGNFKFVVILGNGVCALRMVCLQDTDYLKNAKDSQGYVYCSVHICVCEFAISITVK